MDMSLASLPTYKRWVFIVAGQNIIPTIVSMIGFAYIGIPTKLQVTVRSWLPDVIREHMLMLCTSDSWLIVLLVISIICLIWGGLGSNITASFIRARHIQLVDSYTLLKL
jgi:hypothetical protein